MADEKTLEAMLAHERQWRADVLEVLLRGIGYQESQAQAAHALLAGFAEVKAELAEIRASLWTNQSEDDAEPDPVSIAESLEAIAEMVSEIGQAANLLTAEPDEEQRDDG
jgi:hypothetical protein